MSCRLLHNQSQLTPLLELGESSLINHAKKLATIQQDKDVI